MTEPIDEPTPDTPEPDVELGDDEAPRDMAAVRRLRAENKRLRHELREEQENRGAAAARLAAERRQEAERIAGEVLVDPADIWRVDAAAQQAFVDDEFGEIVADRVVESAKALAASKPHLARPPSGPPPTDRPLEGLRPGATPDEGMRPAPTWSTALRGA